MKHQKTSGFWTGLPLDNFVDLVRKSLANKVIKNVKNLKYKFRCL